METPTLNHMSPQDYLFVYEPAEDSFLMIDALEKEMGDIEALKPTFCLEVGSGSGVVITAFSAVFPHCFCLATDINLKACEVTLSTAEANNVSVNPVNMDLGAVFRPNLFDVIIFNPPYVVTDSSEIKQSDISRSWAGGIKGREVIDRFLPIVSNLLSENGIFYLLLIKENVPKEVELFMKNIGFNSNCVMKRKIRGNHPEKDSFCLCQVADICKR